MPAAGKRAHPAHAGGYRAKARRCVASALPLDPETKRCSFGADTGWIPIKMWAVQIRLICMPWWSSVPAGQSGPMGRALARRGRDYAALRLF